MPEMQRDSAVLSQLDAVRVSRGLLTIDAVLSLVARGNVVFDPFSTLISEHANIGENNVFFPCTYLFCLHPDSELIVGEGNIFHSGSIFSAETGSISIGNRNQFGEGGFIAKANSAGAQIKIEDNGRYLGGASVFGKSTLGSGSQLLGKITVENCTLRAGAPHTEPDPNRRAALLKGQGLARNLDVQAGQVISANGIFRFEDAQPQAVFHPRPTS
jgi:hypothetical protein